MIITQKMISRPQKCEDRSHDKTTRVKMTQDLEHAIDLGLRLYEEDLWHTNSTVFFKTFSFNISILILIYIFSLESTILQDRECCYSRGF